MTALSLWYEFPNIYDIGGQSLNYKSAIILCGLSGWTSSLFTHDDKNSWQSIVFLGPIPK